MNTENEVHPALVHFNKPAQPAAHTPTPWRVVVHDVGDLIPSRYGDLKRTQRVVDIVDANGKRIMDARFCRNYYKPNARYPEEIEVAENTVRAVNSHAELIRSLENLAEKVRLAQAYGQTKASFGTEYEAAMIALKNAY